MSERIRTVMTTGAAGNLGRCVARSFEVGGAKLVLVVGQYTPPAVLCWILLTALYPPRGNGSSPALGTVTGR